MEMEKILLEAERRGRELARLSVGKGGQLRLEAVDDEDGPGLLATARWAARLGIPCRLRLGKPGGSPAWSILAAASLRQGLVDPSAPAERSEARLLRGELEETPALPPGESAWNLPLGSAAPFVIAADAVASPALPPSLCREIDRRAIGDYGIPGISLMENAAVAGVIAGRPLMPHGTGGAAIIVAGGGNNGGDGLAMARGFACLGIPVEVVLSKPAESLSGDAAINLAILAREGKIRIHPLHNNPGDLRHLLEGSAMVVDALLGTGFHGVPSREFALLMDAINRAGLPVLALDLPSGVNGETGETGGAAVRATRTITFAALKTGLLRQRGPDLAGEIFLGDIGAPEAAFPLPPGGSSQLPPTS